MESTLFCSMQVSPASKKITESSSLGNQPLVASRISTLALICVFETFLKVVCCFRPFAQPAPCKLDARAVLIPAPFTNQS
ncbi:hypothetical protein B0T13DRAFT_319047 [Neurospora crassa]|nr:hypothetical protein B0T13DRAFT_319047 [Neurospora crassa]